MSSNVVGSLEAEACTHAAQGSPLVSGLYAVASDPVPRGAHLAPAVIANWGTIQHPACASMIHGVDVLNDWGEYMPSSAPACDGSGCAGTDLVNGQALAWSCGEEGSSISICTLKA